MRRSIKHRFYRKERRQHATLLEVLIALSLTTLLVSLLFFSYRQTTKTLGETQDLLWQTEEQYGLRKRLDTVLPEILPVDEKTPFYTETINDFPSLVFAYNNGVDSEHEYSGDVIGRLYIDQENRLILATWPAPGRWRIQPPPYRTVTLLSEVDHLEIRCFEPPDFDPNPIKSPTGIPDEWNDVWKEEYKTIPALVRLIIDYGDQEHVEATYPIYQANKPIRFYHTKGYNS